MKEEPDQDQEEVEESRQLLSFRLSGEEYGLNVMNVGEVIKAEEKTIKPIPNSKEFVKGITNVRGKVIPILDLETKFGLEPDESRLIVLLEIEDSTCGILVDGVNEVLRVSENRIKDAPDVLQDKIHDQYVEDVALLEDDRMIIILDINQGFEEEEQIVVNEIAQDSDKDEEDEEEEITQEDVKQKVEEKMD